MLLQPNSGYYDPNSQFTATSLASGGGGSRSAADNSSSGGGGGLNSFSDKTFGSSTTSTASGLDSTSSPIQQQQQLQQQQQQQHQQQQSAAVAAQQQQLNFAASNAFATGQAATLPPGYAYFYGQMPSLQAAAAAYGTAYPGQAAMAGVPTTVGTGGGGGASQFAPKNAYGGNA